MVNRKEKILAVIRFCGGEVPLSQLERRHKGLGYGDLGVPKKMELLDWIKTFGSIGTRLNDSGDWVAFEDENANADDYASVDEAISSVEEENLLTLIRKSGGEIGLSQLRLSYKKIFGKDIKCPKKKLRGWIEASASIGTRKAHNKSDILAFDKSPKVDHTVANDVRNPAEVEVDEFVYLSTTGEFASDATFDCADVEEKLIGYLGGNFRPTVVHQDSLSLLNILPIQWSEALKNIGMENVTDVSLDLGRRPYCWHNYERSYLCEDIDHNVEDRDIQDIVSSLQDFGDDNRAGIDGQLHRISCIRNNRNVIIGLTIRVGRHVEGNADMIMDLLQENDKSILLLGEPGSGKTTIVRDVTKILSRKKNVFVVDTSNEIAGDGNIPHPCVGDARRMMVKSLPQQADTMIECVQNHTPSIMVIDEIGRKREVEAAQTSKNRGVRMIASAHGDLRSLIKNKEIRGLIGGLETVTLGDSEAKQLQSKSGSKTIQKQLTTRAAAPIFDVIIELKRGRLNEWHIIPNTAKAVDDILLGEKYDIQKRMRDINSGKIFVECIKN